MATQTNELTAKRCAACEGEIEALRPDEVDAYLRQLDGWRLTSDGKRIAKEWVVKDFLAGMKFFDQVAKLAEDEGHHPDLHLVGYRNVTIELWTHAIGGLSENDFILAAKIEEIPVELKKKSS